MPVKQLLFINRPSLHPFCISKTHITNILFLQWIEPNVHFPITFSCFVYHLKIAFYSILVTFRCVLRHGPDFLSFILLQMYSSCIDFRLFFSIPKNFVFWMGILVVGADSSDKRQMMKKKKLFLPDSLFLVWHRKYLPNFPFPALF